MVYLFIYECGGGVGVVVEVEINLVAVAVVELAKNVECDAKLK